MRSSWSVPMILRGPDDVSLRLITLIATQCHVRRVIVVRSLQKASNIETSDLPQHGDQGD